MTLQVKIDQSGKSSGVPGMAREDLDLGTSVVLTASGGSSYTWALVDAPPNAALTSPSSAQLSSGNGVVVSLTPDHDGTYAGTVESGGVTIPWSFYAGVTLATVLGELPIRIPSFAEASAHNVPDALEPAGNSKGWSRVWLRWFALIQRVASGLRQVSFDISLVNTSNQMIDVRPAIPAGNGRWLLISITLRIETALTGTAGCTTNLRIGSTAGGNEIVLDQLIDTTQGVGTVVGGLAIDSLGSSMSQHNGFQGAFPASQAFYAKSTFSVGTPAAGVVRAHLLWQALP